MCRLSPLHFVPLSPIRSAFGKSSGRVCQRIPVGVLTLLCVEIVNELGNAFSTLLLVHVEPICAIISASHAPLFSANNFHGLLPSLYSSIAIVHVPSSQLGCSRTTHLTGRRAIPTMNGAPKEMAPSDFISAVKREDNKPSSASQQFI